MLFRRLLTLTLLLSPTFGIAQKASPPATSYPQDYFRNPLDIPIFLAGNFGECRPGHFHSGIDIKTKGEENLPVHAAGDGYVSRIKLEKGGFGHGIYITHPNGYTTLYAHLNDLEPAIQKYVHGKQYEKQQWNLDLQLTAAQFPVKKGQLIAYSGNTGASTAPHLHFEIRNTKTEHPLNPQQFGLTIRDDIAPVPNYIALYGTGSIYESISGQFILKKKGDAYIPVACRATNPYLFSGTGNAVIGVDSNLLGIGLIADDYMNGSDNSLTFYTAKLYMDDSLQTAITLDNIGYDVSRYVNAYTDYESKANRLGWVQLLFRLPGNRLDEIYTYLNPNKGRLNVADGKEHRVSIILTDDKGNESKINFGVIANNQVFTRNNQLAGTPFAAGKPNAFNDPNVHFTLDEKQLYDDIKFNFSKQQVDGIYSDKYKLHYPYVPIHHYFDLFIKPNRPIPFNLRSKVVLMYDDDKDVEGSAAQSVDDGWYKTSVRAFGTYWLDIDTTGPVIKSTVKENAKLLKAKQITLTVKDAVTSVRKFAGYIDDKWVCFEQHGTSFFYKFDEHCPKGKHTLFFKAEDENGNTSTHTLTFTR